MAAVPVVAEGEGSAEDSVPEAALKADAEAVSAGVVEDSAGVVAALKVAVDLAVDSVEVADVVKDAVTADLVVDAEATEALEGAPEVSLLQLLCKSQLPQRG